MTLRQRLARAIDPDYDTTCELLDSYRTTTDLLREAKNLSDARAVARLAALDQTTAELAQARAALGRAQHPSRREEGQ